MPQKSYKKVKKEQKTKVKVKSFKTELPKGQNVTNTSFKVKKIQLKEQFKEHGATEITSKRKLNVKDLISRLKHHNAKTRAEALSGLKEVVLTRGEDVLKTFLVPILEATALLAMDQESDVRQAAISLLGIVLSQVDENQLVPLLEPLTRYLACSMSHLDPDIRTDSLHLVDVLLTLPAEYSASHFMSTIFPRFLDMISTSAGDAKRILLLDLNINTTSTLWRVGVFMRLKGLLQAIVKYQTAKLKDKKDFEKQPKSIYWSEKEAMYCPLYHSTFCNILKVEPLTFNVLSSQKRTELDSSNFQYYADILLPLLVDSFAEVASSLTSSSHKEFLISIEAAALLSCITDIILSLWDLLSTSSASSEHTDWFKKKYAQTIYTKFIKERFPYSIGFSDRTKDQEGILQLLEQSKKSIDKGCVEQNINLCRIAALILPKSYPESMSSYLFCCLDGDITINKSKIPILFACLKTVVEAKRNKQIQLKGIDFPQLIHKIINLYNKFKESDSDSEISFGMLKLLASVALDKHFKNLHRSGYFEGWLRELPELLCRQVICLKTLRIVAEIASHAMPAFNSGLETWIEAILDNIPNLSLTEEEDSLEEAKGLIAGLVYHIKQWDDDLLINTSHAIKRNYFGSTLTAYIKDLIEDRIGQNIETL